ncbi:MAG: hypothetical protein QXY94_06695 [Archaeoglobaceae archaeon]
MQTLYWKIHGETRTLVEKPFQSEAEMEKYIFANPDLLGDIYIIYRQIKTGQKQGIPDMLAVDQDARICIIELKNQPADEDILPQALGYAIWAETNPDSVKAIWLESKQKPENIQIDWDKLDIRLILLAPSFKNTVPRMAGKIGYPIDLVQIRRYSFDENEFISVEFIDEQPNTKVTTTKGVTTWDWGYYEAEHGQEATAQFRKVVESIDALVKKKGWNLPYNLNKYYVGFKFGNRVIFNVAWGGTYAWKLKFKIPKDLAVGFKGQDWEFQTYDDTFGEAIFRPLKKSPDIQELEQVLVESYKHVTGIG